MLGFGKNLLTFVAESKLPVKFVHLVLLEEDLACGLLELLPPEFLDGP